MKILLWRTKTKSNGKEKQKWLSVSYAGRSWRFARSAGIASCQNERITFTAGLGAELGSLGG
ncbi:hypothetical protein KPP23_075 [Pseudomonas phage KPP23]|nr:hypothetical protein KPP23_075 [Pseudomonas phage KPP23]